MQTGGVGSLSGSGSNTGSAGGTSVGSGAGSGATAAATGNTGGANSTSSGAFTANGNGLTGSASTGGSPTPVSTAVGTSRGATVTAACGTGQMGPGVTAKTIKLGLQYAPDVSQANQSLGGNSWRTGEPDSDYEAFIKYFNATGGICGRQIVAVPWNDQVVSGETADTQDQAACTAWTQDNKVFAGAIRGDFLPIDSCMKSAGEAVVQIDDISQQSEADLGQYPNVLAPFAPSYDRFNPVFVDALAANGYLTRGARVGLLYTNIPSEEQSVQASLIPDLKAKGVTLVDSAVVDNTVDVDSLGQAESQTDEAVLRFQSEHIDHVLAPYDAFSLDTFAMRAQQQGYSPRYGVSTSDGGGARGGLGQNAQFDGAVGVVWTPSLSYSEAEANPGTAFCLNILKEEGLPPPEDQGSLDLMACDFLVFLRAALDHAPNLTEAGLLAAAQQIGVQSGDSSWEWTMSPTRHDGTAAYRVITYSGGTNGQWKYLTPLAPLP